MSQNRDSQSTPPRFLDVAKEVCEDAKFDISVSTAGAAELQQQMEKEYSDGVTELGLHPYAAARRALELFDPPSAVKQCKKPVVERLLFSDKYRPMRWFLITVAVLTGMIAYFRSDGFKNGREVGWVQRVIDLVRWVIGCIGGMCFLTEISVLLGLRQKSRALYSRGSELLLCRLGGRGGQIAVPMGLALLFIALVVRHGGLPPASDADRSMAAKSPSPASNSITEHRLSEGVRGVAEEESRTVKPAGSEPKGSTGAGSSVSSTVAGATVSTAKLDVNEASRTVTSSAEEKSGAVELDGSKPAVAIADAPPSDGLVAS
jgi:hypothetical protein